jgi:hypothetical protein
MNADLQVVPGLAGMALSLAASYFPGIKTAYEKLDQRGKQLVMGALIVVVAVAQTLWKCSANGTCGDATMWRELGVGLLSTLVGNTATHQATKHLRKGNGRSDRSIPIVGVIRPCGGA